jgi:hypothetical protein
MDLTKRLGLPADLLKQATEVLEGKKISHPNQEAISAAAPPENEITAADFKALRARKKYKVEGVDRGGKVYESPLFETEDQAVALYNKIRKSAPISNLKIVEVTEKVDEVVEASAPIVNSANAKRAGEHDCAMHVEHKQWGAGETVPTMHADPDADGNIAWYDVMFEHGIEQNVPTSDLEITLSEMHVHKKSKRMSEAAEQHGKEKKSNKKSTDNVEMNPVTKEEVEQVDEKFETRRNTPAKIGVGVAPSPHGDNPAYKPTKVPAELKNKPPTPVKPFKVKEEVELEEADTKVRGRFGGVNITHSTHGAFKAEYEPDAHTVDTPEAAVDIEVKHPDGKKSDLVMDHNGLKHQSGPKLPAEVHAALEKHAGKYRKNSLVGTNKLEEGRTKGRRQAVLGDTNHPDHEAAAAKFKELTGGKGNPGSYYHRENKYKDQADAAIAHAKKVASSGNSSSDASSDDSAEKHPHYELRSAADLPKGGKVAGQQVSQAQAKALDDRLNKMKPAEREAAYPKIRNHIAQIKKEIP